MPERDDITSHYGRGGLADDILAAACLTLPPGAPGAPLTATALAPAGEFHLGGVEATARFVPRLGFGAGMEILAAAPSARPPATWPRPAACA